MKRLSFLAIMAMQVHISATAHATDYLQPEYGPLRTMWFEWNAAVRRTLLHDLPYDSTFVVIAPSFEPEEAVFLREAEDTLICSRIAERQVWTESPDSTKFEHPVKSVEECESISKELAQKIKRAWSDVLIDTRYPALSLTERFDDVQFETFDGVAYHFSTFLDGHGGLDGFVANPHPTTRPGRLAKLADSMSQYALNPTSALREEIRHDADRITTSMARLLVYGWRTQFDRIPASAPGLLVMLGTCPLWLCSRRTQMASIRREKVLAYLCLSHAAIWILWIAALILWEPNQPWWIQSSVIPYYSGAFFMIVGFFVFALIRGEPDKLHAAQPLPRPDAG